MCNFWTCILTSDGKAHYSKDSSSHEELIKKLKPGVEAKKEGTE